jgi:hypothetical protein
MIMVTDTGTTKAKAMVNDPNETEPSNKTVARNITLKKP